MIGSQKVFEGPHNFWEEYGLNFRHKGVENVILKVYQWIVELKDSWLTSRSSMNVEKVRLFSEISPEAVLTHLRAIALFYPCFSEQQSKWFVGVFFTELLRYGCFFNNEYI